MLLQWVSRRHSSTAGGVLAEETVSAKNSRRARRPDRATPLRRSPGAGRPSILTAQSSSWPGPLSLDK